MKCRFVKSHAFNNNNVKNIHKYMLKELESEELFISL
jgi:hypothetical protein